MIKSLALSFCFLCMSITSMAQVVDTLTSVKVYEMLTSCEYTTRIIDGRDSAKFYSGHLKNAVYIDAFSDQAVPFLTKYLNEDCIIIYCTNKTRSLLLIDKLKGINYQGKILYMQDGITGWKKNGYRIEMW